MDLQQAKRNLEERINNATKNTTTDHLEVVLEMYVAAALKLKQIEEVFAK